MSEIKTIYDSGKHTLAIFKSASTAITFENYLKTLGSHTGETTKVKSIRDFSGYLYESIDSLVEEGYSFIYSRYIYTKTVKDFISFMED